MSTRRKILIVEDEEMLRNALRTKLSHEGFAVSEAGNGRDGLAAALAEHPDLILLDIVMPVMDGMTMLSKLRQDDWGKDVQVIILTNLNTTDTVVDSLDKHAFDYLVKSDWKLEDVVAKIRDRLGM